MFQRMSSKLLVSPTIAAGVLAASLFGLGAVTSTSSTAGSVKAIPVNLTLESSVQSKAEVLGAEDAAIEFVRDLSAGKSNVWNFASEEDQGELASQQDAVTAFTQAYPPLAHAVSVDVGKITADGDLQRVLVYVKDTAGLQWSAGMSLWLDDAGDWKVVKCEVQPAPDGMV